MLCFMSAKVYCEPPKPATVKKAESKAEPNRIPVRAAKDLDYAIISMGYVANSVVAKRQPEIDKIQKEINEEIAKLQKDDRAKVREIEKQFGIRMFDDNWFRCCDTLDPLTGVVTKNGFKKTRVQ